MNVFTVEKIEKQLVDIRQAVYRETRPISHFKFHEGDCLGAQFPDYDDGDWDDFYVGDTWGGYDVVAWFRTAVPIPPGWHNRRLYLQFLVGPRDGGGSTAETMLYVNDKPLQGIDVWHEEAWIPPEHLQDDHIFVALKAWSGVLDVPDYRRFKLARLIWIDEATEKFYHLSRVLLQALRQMEEQDLRRIHILQALNEAYYEIDFHQPKSEAFYLSVCDALTLLERSVREMEGIDTALKPTIYAIGHAHIDLAWLWRLQHSREKAARTFATTLHLMRQYPEYRFVHSSPQLYKYLKADYPDIYARVKERIQSRQWEITGGMWVESDVNIPNGESLVRQFLLGRQYIREEFGVETNLLWLPDVFGYSWSLPQIARQSGIKYFLTSKISWNQFNRFPYDTFRWRGIDGTELLTYFITTPSDDDSQHTYNGTLSPRDVKGTWELYAQKEANDQLLTLFGWGDGGGGPTKEMLESGRVLKDLPGFPQVKQQKAEEFFARLADRMANENLPVWDGELYLELHRGTYTSQAYNKRANRKSEVLYHNAEWLSTLASILKGQNDYPAYELREGWEILLLNQFHDILPGSSIREVYEDSSEDYECVREIGEAALAGAQERIEAAIATEGASVVAYNSLAWARDGLVSLPWSEELADKRVVNPSGRTYPPQLVTENGNKRLLFHVESVPALGYAAYSLSDAAAAPDGEPLVVTPTRLENRFYRLTLNERGQLTSIWDKQRQREVLADGACGNVLQAFMDKPLKFDAWDIDIFYQEQSQELGDLFEVEVEETGPLRGVLRLRWRFHESIITQRLTIYRHSPRLDFRTEVDWHEQQTLLKVAFPVAVRSTRATYDIQFGSIERPTHWNTSWDYARFEVPAQKWADLSEGDYGVALLNDCKYGYDVKDNVMRLTLIKSSVRPDPLADKGYHQFTYSLLPHAGDWRQGNVVREAYDLNYDMLASAIPSQRAGVLPPRYQLASLDAGHVILETVKQAEDGDGWIVRVYEYQQRRNPCVSLSFGPQVRRVVPCNLVEEPVADPSLHHNANCVTFAIKPYEIKSFRVWLEAENSE